MTTEAEPPTDQTDQTDPTPMTDPPDPPDQTNHNQTATGQTRDLYDDLAPEYDDHYTEPIHAAEDLSTAVMLMSFLQRDPPPLILDLGCGTGWLVSNFSNTPLVPPNRYTGIDLSASMIAAAQAKHPEYTFFQSDIRDFPDSVVFPFIRDDTNLVVSTFGTLSHMPAETWVPILAQLVPQDGRYFLTLLTRSALDRKSSLAHTHPHLIHTPGANELREILTAHQLEPTLISGINPWGDDVPEGAGVEGEERVDELAEAIRVDMMAQLESAEEDPDTRHLLLVAGGRF